jgi:hypothetical protein
MDDAVSRGAQRPGTEGKAMPVAVVR